MRKIDVAIIGGGPAGMSAAVAAKKAGAKDVLIIERDHLLGGILQQCIHNGFGLHKFGEELTGPEYAERYENLVKNSSIELLTDTMVVDLTEKKILTCVNESMGRFSIEAKAVVLAMGCRERPRGALNVPGERPAGVITAGTAQKFVNIKGYMPGKEIDGNVSFSHLRKEISRPGFVSCQGRTTDFQVRKTGLQMFCGDLVQIKKLRFCTAPGTLIGAVVRIKIGLVPDFPVLDIEMIPIRPTFIIMTNNVLTNDGPLFEICRRKRFIFFDSVFNLLT